MDVNAIEVFRPKGRFEEAKIYWDAKNKMYSLKFEVAITATPPYYALFVFKGKVGSEHDFSIHKKNYTSYLDYLRKTEGELSSINFDRTNRNWAILGDRAYDSNEIDTPLERRVFIKKTQKV